ncbi:YacL family protein [Catenovulum sp. SM1970]|uniref:YacL family protein n=1 Tax=Marinifaba aquimaris TaxID=2741323 RepID=UPI00157401A0|nr:YacL family protein [Marinifaba aquimaris]NTS78554.1 YacL family protein [Marinifaba aquimaris]
MDFEFRRDLEGNFKVSLDDYNHALFATWLNDELIGNPSRARYLLNQLTQLESKQIPDYIDTGKQLYLTADQYEVVIRVNDDTDLTEIDLPDEILVLEEHSSEAGCGLVDFIRLIQALLDFID